MWGKHLMLIEITYQASTTVGQRYRKTYLYHEYDYITAIMFRGKTLEEQQI